MNKNILAMVQDREDKYPRELESRYPRILEKIAKLWGTAEMQAYFDDLLLDNRGNRSGFPREVAHELFSLHVIHNEQYQHLGKAATDPWGEETKREKAEMASTPAQLNLLKAAEMGDVQAVQAYLKESVSLNANVNDRWTPLSAATFNGHHEVVEILLSHGAHPDIADANGYTSLHWAAFQGHTNIVKQFLIKGTDVNKKTAQGWAPLLHAASKGHLEIVALLLDHHASVNASDKDGWTALHKACANGHYQVVELLLDRGADVNSESKDGITPVQVAMSAKHQDIAQLLVKKGIGYDRIG